MEIGNKERILEALLNGSEDKKVVKDQLQILLEAENLDDLDALLNARVKKGFQLTSA